MKPPMVKHSSRQLQLGARVINVPGQAGTIVKVEGPRVLFDYQRPSSKPKLVPAAELRFVSPP